MTTSEIGSGNSPEVLAADTHTWNEIRQQPALWPTTYDRLQKASANVQPRLEHARVLLTGAGTSAYAAAAVSAAWPRSQAVPSTDLLVATEHYIDEIDVLVSLGRSGNSPESVAVVDRVHRIRPEVWHLALTCNSQGRLATSPLVQAIVLDPRTNDKSLVMTSSFSNLLLAGLCLARKESIGRVVESAVAEAEAQFNVIDQKAKTLAGRAHERIVFLAAAPLFGWAQEAALKVTEMTAGSFPAIAETYLGLRHGPMSFIRPNTLVVCLLSNDRTSRPYEEDLVRELRDKKIGYRVGIARDTANGASELFDEVIPPLVPQAPDILRAPFEILGPQLLGYHLSLRAGLNPDNPSPNGVINRVVPEIRIYG